MPSITKNSIFFILTCGWATLLGLLPLSVASQDNKSSARKQKKASVSFFNCDSLLNCFENNPCKALSFLLYCDSPVNRGKMNKYYLRAECHADIVRQLSGKSGLKANLIWIDKGPPFWGYINSKIGKSVYTIDMLRWMRYFKCADTTAVRKKVQGPFTAKELDQINKSHGAIDTMILYDPNH